VSEILPNIVSPIIVTSTVLVAYAILAEAGLSFLGLGVQPPTASWGMMLSRGQTYIRIAPWLALFPGIALVMTVLSINLLGDGLRDIFDPEMRGET
jgi:peptide/nickel transport system permease protein